MTLSAGTRLGPYEIVAKIGAGGMGVVYRAHDEHLDREVAIKVLPADCLHERARAKAVSSAKRSSRTGQAVHPHIAHVHDFSSESRRRLPRDGTGRGQSLAHSLAGGRLPPSGRLSRLGCQLASALEEAHGQGIVHRDLKPGNVMVTPRAR